MLRRKFIKTIGMTVLACGPVVALPTLAQDVDFSGETIEWIVPLSEGGGTDVWVRFLAPYLSKHLPGNPNVIVLNIPGGGSIVGANDFALRARPDGLSLLATTASTQLPALLGDARVRYDYTEFEPLVISPTGAVLYVSPELGVEDASQMDQLLDTELVFGSLGPTSIHLVSTLAFNLLGLDVNHVFGMTGGNETRLAFERGEVNIDSQTTSSYLASVVPLVEEGKAVPLFTLGVFDAQGEFQRDPTFPDLPHVIEVYEMMYGEPPSGVEFDAFKSIFGAAFAAQKLAMLKKGTPSEILDVYRQAFVDMMADPDLQANAGDILGSYEQAVGNDIQQLYTVATSIDPEAREWVREFLTDNYNVEF